MNAVAPLQRWKRDDWVIPCTLRDAAGGAEDLTGRIIGAELWLAGYSVFQPLTVANGGIVRVSDVNGQFTVVASRLLTSQALADALALISGQRTRVLIDKIDTMTMATTAAVAAAFALIRAAGFVGKATQIADIDLPEIGHQIGVARTRCTPSSTWRPPAADSTS